MILKIMDKEAIYEEIATLYVKTVNENPKCTLGFATGSSPIGVYKKIIEKYNKNEVSFKEVTSFNLDEYVGLDENHNQSYRYFMNQNLFNHIDINKNKTYVPKGTGDLLKNAEDYEKLISSAGGIDLQILGIGTDGHIAFNEPGTKHDSLTHIARLAESTIKDNSRFFASIDEVPTLAITMGLKSIMNAKKIVLIATGSNKASAILGLVKGEVSEELPCSVLQNHPDVTIYMDEEAASLIK